MTILPDTIYKYRYRDSIFLARTFLEPIAYNTHSASDIYRISGTEPLTHIWDFAEYVENGTITILECYDRATYPEMYI